MRLLDVRTKELHEFQKNIPPYAILSHTWDQDEVSFQDLIQGPASASRRAGWYKIEKSCEIAAGDGWSWIWIDACCIDKSSSTELSEAINSMMKWYEWSVVCYAYLFDYSGRTRSDRQVEAFVNCRWFTRGWTLQELIAPREVWFYDVDWKSIGSRTMLSHAIERATGASLRELTDFRSCSIAKRMSWASKRQTSREEDIAYCLLGLFDINMPLLYGEGAKAFTRLQLEIMKTSDDESVFIWKAPDEDDAYTSNMLIAPHPSCFQHSGHIIVRNVSEDIVSNFKAGYTMTNKGLQLERRIFLKSETSPGSVAVRDKENEAIVPLNCFDESKNCFVALRLSIQSDGIMIPVAGAQRLVAPFDAYALSAGPLWTSKWQSMLIRNPELRESLTSRGRNCGRAVSLRYSNHVVPKVGHMPYDDAETSQVELIEPTERIVLHGTSLVLEICLTWHSDVLLIINKPSKSELPQVALLHSEDHESPRSLLQKIKLMGDMFNFGSCAVLQPAPRDGREIFLTAQVKPVCGLYGELQSAICIEYPVTNGIIFDAAKMTPELSVTEEQTRAFHGLSQPWSIIEPGGSTREPDGGMDDYVWPDFR